MPTKYVDPTGELIWFGLPLVIGGGGTATVGTVAGGVSAGSVAVGGLGMAALFSIPGDTPISSQVYREKVDAIVENLNKEGQDSRTIPWSPKKPGKWTCICRADANERSPDLTCEFIKMFAFGWGVGPSMQDAYQKAERMAKGILRASSVHHVQCKCTGPAGQKVNRGS